MADQKDERSTTDQILDLLLDALAERQKARLAGRLGSGAAGTSATELEEPERGPGSKRPTATERPEAAAQRSTSPTAAEPAAKAEMTQPTPSAERRIPSAPKPSPSTPRTRPLAHRPEPRPGDEGWEPPPRQPSIQMGRMMGRLALLTAVLIVLVNIPVTRYGVSLARILPETSSLIIRDGLVLKGSGPEIYMLENDQLRWISSMDAFEHLGLSWGDVHIVEDAFLEKFEMGRPIHVVLKCPDSPHIYRLENDQKRWIKDIDAFEAEGLKWEDVRFVSCQYLRDLPTGPSIPEDAGPAPEP